MSRENMCGFVHNLNDGVAIKKHDIILYTLSSGLLFRLHFGTHKGGSKRLANGTVFLNLGNSKYFVLISFGFCSSLQDLSLT